MNASMYWTAVATAVSRTPVPVPATTTTREERIAKANYELSFESQYDTVVVNDILEETFATCEKLVSDFIQN